MNILIVDDAPANLRLLRAMIQSEGVTVFEAHDGMQALAVLEREPVDAIISDVLMPRMDGYRLCREVRRHPRLAKLPFIFCAGTYPSADAEKLALALGADRFLRKPIHRNALLATLKEITTKGRRPAFPNARLPAERGLLQEYDLRLVQRLEQEHDLLSESQRSLVALVNSIDATIWMADAKPFRPTFISLQAERMFGYPVKALNEPDSWVRIVHPGDRERVRAGRAGCARDLIGHELEYRVVAAGGRLVRVRESISALQDANPPGRLCGIVIDVTARNQAEEALRESEVRHRVLVDGLPDGILVSSDDRVVFANQAALKLFGAHRPEELLGRPVLDLMPPEERERARQTARRVMGGGTDVCFEERRIVRLDGNAAEVESTGIPFVYQGKPATELILRDNVERKRLEERLRQSQKLEAIGQLAGGVAHDFNNLLTVIQLHAASLLSGGDLAEKAADSVQQITIAAQHAAGLTRQLLTFSRKQVVEMVDLDLNELVANLIRMLQRILGEDVQLKVSFSPVHLWIHADAGMMEQVLMNLAVNARDAMPRGGELTIQTEAVHLGEAAAQASPEARPGHFACLRVSDAGEGIAPEYLPRIFEPFFSTKETGKGTGLGLATVYGIVKQHQGWITVESQPGQGATFSTFLPRKTAPAPTLETPCPHRRPPPRGTETILLVEDEAPVRRVVQNILGQLGYRVFTAESGVAALRVWREHRDHIELLLTDLVMPDGLMGRELAEKLWAEAPHLPVIFTSGYSPELGGQDRGLGGGVPYLQKPYAPEELANLVRQTLDTAGG
ncbi:MAG: response regulator [Verrucomicrobia bacterium]|nr:response regulator [Verrucomicrobiota bacterium]